MIHRILIGEKKPKEEKITGLMEFADAAQLLEQLRAALVASNGNRGIRLLGLDHLQRVLNMVVGLENRPSGADYFQLSNPETYDSGHKTTVVYVERKQPHGPGPVVRGKVEIRIGVNYCKYMGVTSAPHPDMPEWRWLITESQACRIIQMIKLA